MRWFETSEEITKAQEENERIGLALGGGPELFSEHYFVACPDDGMNISRYVCEHCGGNSRGPICKSTPFMEIESANLLRDWTRSANSGIRLKYVDFLEDASANALVRDYLIFNEKLSLTMSTISDLRCVCVNHENFAPASYLGKTVGHCLYNIMLDRLSK